MEDHQERGETDMGYKSQLDKWLGQDSSLPVNGSEDPRQRKQTLPNISQNLMIKYAYLLYPPTDFQQQGHNNYFIGTLCNCLYKACKALYSKILNKAADTEWEVA